MDLHAVPMRTILRVMKIAMRIFSMAATNICFSSAVKEMSNPEDAGQSRAHQQADCISQEKAPYAVMMQQWLCQISVSKKIKSRRVVATKIATLSGADPAHPAQGPSDFPVHHEREDRDACKEGRDDIVIVSPINAVDIHQMSWLLAAHVQA